MAGLQGEAFVGGVVVGIGRVRLPAETGGGEEQHCQGQERQRALHYGVASVKLTWFCLRNWISTREAMPRLRSVRWEAPPSGSVSASRA